MEGWGGVRFSIFDFRFGDVFLLDGGTRQGRRQRRILEDNVDGNIKETEETGRKKNKQLAVVCGIGVEVQLTPTRQKGEVGNGRG